MKTMTKVILGGAMLAGAAAAQAQIPIPSPSTDASELLFFVNDYGNGTTYTVALSQVVGNAAGSYFNSADAQNTSAVKGTTIGTITGDANFSVSFAGDTTLANFISGAAGQVQWGIMGSAYPGNVLPDNTRGDSLVVSTGTKSTILGVLGASVGNTIPTGMSADISTIQAQTFDSFNGTTNGTFCTPGSSGDGNCDLYANGVVTGEAIGTSNSLYGLAASTKGGSYDYLLGTATFNGTTLAFTGIPSAVPLPAAAWLFGSGLLGLLGIGRRKRTAIETA